MPITGLVDEKKPLHRRNNSGELDVFEAARYYNDNYALNQKVIKEERQGYLRGGRVSLDMPTLRHAHHDLFNQVNHPLPQAYPQKQQQIKDKNHKQPSSPGGKLAHFLNSLFGQSSSKKKKSSSKSSSQSMKDEDESPSGRRKRRSSISHFRSTNSAVDAKSYYSSSSSGFRTPPPYNLNTPTKCYKDFKTFSDHKEALGSTLSRYSITNGQNGGSSKPRRGNNDERSLEQVSSMYWFDEKFNIRNAVGEKPRDLDHAHQEKKSEIIKNFKEEVDDGAESDSSSDLFELQIDYGFGFCSSGLPVYETTHMDSIKRSSTTAITNGPIKN